MKTKFIVLAIATFASCALAQPHIEASPGEPEYYEQYRAAALYLVDSVTSSVDAVKEFRQSEAFGDIATSTQTQTLYRHKIDALEFNLRLVNENLLSTPTAVMTGADAELRAIQSMNQYRE